MNKYSLRVKYAGSAAYYKYSYDAPDMETAVKCGYDWAKSENQGIPIIEFIVSAKD